MNFEKDDAIVLKGLAFYGYHGVTPEEGKVGCRFSLDVTCGIDLRAAAASDDVDQTISYAYIFDTVSEAFAQHTFKLIEALAQHIVDELFKAHTDIAWVQIRVAKPEAPIPVVTGEFAVRMTRKRPK